jgi:hypothetical protein
MNTQEINTINEIIRQVAANNEGIAKRIEAGGDKLETLREVAKFLGKTANACEIGLAAYPGNGALDRIMQVTAADIVDTLTQIKKLEAERARKMAAAQTRTTKVTIH